MGLAAGLAVIFMIEMLTNVLFLDRDVENKLGLPHIASVPMLRFNLLSPLTVGTASEETAVVEALTSTSACGSPVCERAKENGNQRSRVSFVSDCNQHLYSKARNSGRRQIWVQVHKGTQTAQRYLA